MSISNGLVTIIDMHYGDVGGGAKPEYIVNLLDRPHSSPFPPKAEYIAVWLPVPVDIDPINTDYVTAIHELKVRMSTPTSDTRLKEIVDEVRTLICANATAGTIQRISSEQDMSDRRGPIYIYELTVELVQIMIPLGTAYDGWSYTAHLHNGDVLELDGVNSDGGAFAFNTTGIVTFNQSIITDNDLRVAGGHVGIGIAPSANNAIKIVTTLDPFLAVYKDAWKYIEFRMTTGGTRSAYIGVDATENVVFASDTGGSGTGLMKLIATTVEISGELTVSGDLTAANIITAGNVDGVDVSALETTVGALVEDAAYGAGWNGDTTHAPSQNAVYDQLVTHYASVDEHHAKWTTADTEGVITAEIVGGQSIDNAIDALINTHNAADNHIAHSGVSIVAGTGMTGGGAIDASKTLNVIGGVGITVNANDIDCDITQYTDGLARTACVSDAAYAAGWNGITNIGASKNAVYDKINGMDTLIAANTTVLEVEAVITAEIVAGQSIDNAIDALINTHTSVEAAHGMEHNDLTDTTMTGAQLEDATAYAAANAAYEQCIPYYFSSNYSANDTGAWLIFRNKSGTDVSFQCVLPLPTNRGSLKLYITGLRVVVFDADANDYVDRVRVYGGEETTVTLICDEPTNRTAQDTYDTAIALHDCSGYSDVKVMVETFCTTAQELAIVSVQLLCHYAA